MLQDDDIYFLKNLIKKYPELKALTEEAESSPEGNQILSPDALAYRVFDEVSPSAIEADRTLFSLLLLKDIINNDNKRFPYISAESFQNLRAFTLSCMKNKRDEDLLFYSLACNDLGKTKYFVNMTKADDHDQLLAKLIEEKPEIFTIHSTEYINNLKSAINLGQFVQGECTPASILSKPSMLHLCMEIFDFAGATGHINHNISILMTEDNLWAFLEAIKSLESNNPYYNYMKKRGEKAGIDTSSTRGFAITRIISMARIFQKEKTKEIETTFNNLPEKIQKILIEELNISGLEGKKAILIYYAPALIKSCKDIKTALNKLAEIYQKADKENSRQGNGNIIINVSHIIKELGNMQKIYAKEAIPQKISKSIFLAGPSPRDSISISWRGEALSLLERLGYDGVVYVPEYRGGYKDFPEGSDANSEMYVSQIDWERAALDSSDCIIFWIPRDDKFPGFTTNVEFGLYVERKNLAIGAPKNAVKNSYIQKECMSRNIPWYTSLEETLEEALKIVGNGKTREGDFAKIPQCLFNIKGFEEWLSKFNAKEIKVNKFINQNDFQLAILTIDGKKCLFNAS